MFFVDEQNGWLTGTCNGVAPGVLLFNTTDGGSTWQKVALAEPADQPGLFDNQDVNCGSENPQVDSNSRFHLSIVCQFYATDPRTVISYDYTLSSDGQTWSSKAYPGGILAFTSGGKILAAGENWQISTDDESTWSEMGFTRLPVRQIQQPEDGSLYAISQDDTHGLILYSRDTGTTWTEIQPGLK